MTERNSVALGGGEPPTLHLRATVSRMLLIGGASFALIGFVDMALLWFPANPGNVAWEYATVGRTLDSVPLSSLGLLLIGYGVLRAGHPTRTSVLFVAATFFVYALLNAFLAFLVFTSAPAVILQTPPEAADAVRRAATRHGIQAVVYPLAWFVIGVTVWRARSSGEAT